MAKQERMSEYIQKDKRGTILRTLKYFAINPKKTALSLVLTVLLNVANIVQPLVIMIVIDNYLVTGNFDGAAILGLAGLYLFIVLAANGTGYAQTQVLRSLTQEILHKIRTTLFSHVQNMSMTFFDNNSSGRILTRVTNDVESLSELYSSFFIMFIREILLVIGMLVTMFILNPAIAALCLIAMPIVLGLSIFYRTIARRNFIKLKALLSRINGYLAENIVGMKIIQIFNRENVKFEAFDDMNEEYYRLGMIEVMLNGLLNPFVTMVSNLMVAVLIVVFHGSVTGGYLEIGVLFAFTTYVRQLFAPIANIADQVTTAQSALISADRVFDIMDNTEDVEDFAQGSAFGTAKGMVEFKNVWFAYGGAPAEGEEPNWVLKDVSFVIRPGMHAAFVGATGCGKTTIMNLISRFYEIQKGQILIDGRDVRDIDLHSLRRNVAVVMQDVFLFTGDIRHNIRLNNDHLKNKDIEEAARTANCHDMILGFGNGYLHQVAQRGSDLSLGQRQLISFARAIAAKPSLLILDEATASIDPGTEQALQAGLADYAQGKTLLTIAHRISTIVNSDVIFVMDKGVIVESGNHESLLQNEGGIYRKLHTLSIARD